MSNSAKWKACTSCSTHEDTGGLLLLPAFCLMVTRLLVVVIAGAVVAVASVKET